ncbi:MAG: mandelate racemase/muconate lactonizing enzyme family protein [Actinomycetia bacterium]|nr:mandelate racemase/muconate lactonizing enzyme family protein [Actinomycetes bacterium]
MQIESHEVIVLDVPLERPFMGIAEARHVVLRLRTDDGLEGLGWVGWFRPTMIPSLAAAVDAVASELTGLDPNHRLRTMETVSSMVDVVWWGPGISRYVEAMVEFALYDLAGKAVDLPVAALLGAGGIESVPAYASQHLWRDWPLGDLDSGAGALAAEGWRAMKFRIGANAHGCDEVDRARVVREAVGEHVEVMVDVNEGWDLARTKEVAPLLEPYRLAWLEDPIDHRDLDGYRRLVGTVGIPITHGEYHKDIHAFGRIAADRSADVVMIDAHHVGGVDPWIKAAHACELAHLPVATHLSPEIGVHLGAATPNCRTVEYMDWSVALFNERLQLDAEGRLVVPHGPGWGVTLDEDLIRRRRV